MKKCNSCGKEFEDGVFCPECGGKLETIMENTNKSSAEKMFCPNCGTKLNVDAVFCPNCGWSKTGAKKPKGNVKIPKFDLPKSGSSIFKFIPIAAVALIAIFVIKILFFGGVGKNANAIINSSNNTFRALSKNEVFDVVSNTFSKGSLGIELSNIPEISDTNIPIDGNGNLKMHFNKDKFAITFDGKIAGVKCEDNIIYLDNAKTIAKIPSAFGEKVYGINFKNLPDSWIMDSLRLMDETTYNSIKNQIEEKNNIDTNAIKKEISSIYKTFSNELKKSIKKNLKFSNENDEISLNGKDVKVLKVSTKITDNQAKKVIIDILKWLKSDKKVKNFIKKYPTIAQAFLSGFNYRIRSNDYTGTELYSEFTDMVDSGLNYYDSYSEGDATFDVQFNISKANKQVVRIVLSVDSDRLTFTCGPDWKNPSICSLKSNDSDIFTYTAQNDGSEYTYNFNSNGYNVVKMKWDKKSGDFTMNFNNAEYKLTGKMKVGNTTSFVLNRFSGGNGWSAVDIKPNATITLKKKDSFPHAPGKFEDIANMSMSDFESVMKDALDKISDKFGLGNLSRFLF